MSRFTFKSDSPDLTVEMSVNVTTLSEACGLFADFLRACGYYVPYSENAIQVAYTEESVDLEPGDLESEESFEFPRTAEELREGVRKIYESEKT